MTTIRQKLLFVYGTLKRGYRNHRLLAEQTFISEAVTLPVYRLYDNGSYPCLVLDPQNGISIEGEIYLIDIALFRLLDQLEDVPTLYRRELIQLNNHDTPAEGYLYQQSVESFVDCGSRWPVKK